MIRLELLGVPPTANNAYENVPKKRLRNGQMVGGGRKLTEEGRAYLTTTKTTLVQRFTQEMRFFTPNTPYLMVVRIFFEAVENKGYPKIVSTRYKKADTTNRIKLLEDALKDAGGFDDSQTLTTVCQKVTGIPERTVLWIWNLDNEESPFDAALLTLQ